MATPHDAAPLLKHVNALVDPLASKRFEALKEIHNSLLAADARNNTQEYISHVFEDVLSKPLLRRFADPSEKCRFLSITLFSKLLKLCPKSIASLLPYIFPVISERFPIEIIQDQSSAASIAEEIQFKTIRIEQSEEIRLILVQLIHQLLTQGKRLIGPFASDVASILMSAASDNDPSILMEVCSTLKSFAHLMGNNLKNVCKNLISVILHALHHNRCRVRVSCLQAIERLVLCGPHTSIYGLTAYRDPNIIPIREFYHPSVKTQYLALLASDRSVMVREALLRTVSCWLLELPEKKEHEMRLLPYILNGFRDENKEIQELAFDLMESIGQQYENENEDEVKDRKQYLPEDIVYGEASPHLPPFFKRRPCLGARIMVKRSFGVLLHALTADLQAWQQEPKMLAAELLYVIIMFMEENATMHLQALIVAIIKAWSNKAIQKKIQECAMALGSFINPSSYLEILIPRITGEYDPDASMVEIGRTLQVLSWMMKGSPSVTLTIHIPEIFSVLTNQELISSLQEEVHEGIFSTLEVTLAAFDKSCTNELITVLWILLNTYAIGEMRKKPCNERMTRALGQLCKLVGFQKTSDIIIEYLDDITKLLEAPQKWASCMRDPIICIWLLEETSSLHNPASQKLIDMLQEFATSNEGYVKCGWLADRVSSLLSKKQLVPLLETKISLSELPVV